MAPDGVRHEARTPRPATRAEAKELSRSRLLRAATELLDQHGGSKLSVSAVARRAGMAQSSFYVHFRDLDDLLRTLGDEMAVRRGRDVREARRRVREDPDAERVRETFRIPLDEIVSNPEWYRTGLRALYDPESPLGEVIREMLARERRDLVDDLLLAGFRTDAPRGRSVEMTADCLAAMTEALAQGHLDGRYPELDEILDVLVQIFFAGVISFFDGGGSPARPEGGVLRAEETKPTSPG
jgi:TetR/AcrR family transcriptional regulator, fatty acid biosynthesis regulator